MPRINELDLRSAAHEGIEQRIQLNAWQANLQREELAGGRAAESFEDQRGTVVRRPTVVLAALPGAEEAGASELDHDAATKLTQQIKSSLGQASHLLLAAHEGRAWKALGHRTWESYVGRELGLSRRRSYELLDQARVARAIASAARMSGIPHISAHAAEQLKPVLDDVLTTIRQCLESAVGDEDADGVVNEVVRAARRSVAERSNNATLTRRSTQEHLPRLVSTDDDDCSTRLAAAIETLCHMPAPAEVSQALDEDRSLRASAEHAAGWLQALIHLMPN